MLKNKRNPNIVSRIFDTINNMSLDNDKHEDENAYADSPVYGESIYIVSVPNEKHLLKLTPLKPVVICIYQVRTDGLYPYILFLLQKYTDNFSFIQFSSTYKKIKYAAISQMNTLLPEQNLTYDGLSETVEQTIIILKYTEDTITYDTLLDDTEYIWATPFEIINTRKIGKSSVSKKVFDFFIENTEFLILKTSKKCVYETPMIGYALSDENNIEDMDIYRETIIPSFGKSYYLLVDIPENTTKPIMRIAFFAGKMLVYDGIKKKYDLPYKSTYNSLLCEKKYYIIHNYDQHVLLNTVNKIL